MDERTQLTVEHQGILLDINWNPGSGIPVTELPTTYGIYAEIYWPTRGVRIGETGRSIRGKIRHDIRWFRSMHNGTAPPSELRRTIPIAMTAKEHGEEAFEFYVVSADHRLSDKSLRQDCERFMFAWLEEGAQYESWNHQRSWH